MRPSSLIALVLMLFACSRETAPVPAPAPGPALTPAAVPAPAASSAPARTSTAKIVEAPKDLTSLAARLHYEASHRPAAGPHAEQVLDAIDADGLAVVRRRQYLGLAVHASYCAGGTTRDGLAISICEYATPDDAARGKTFADRQFAAITDAQRATRGNALLTVVGAKPDATRALHTFATL